MAITKINSLGVNLSSPLTFSAGTVSLPSITFSGDTNTGVFAPAADTIGFTEGGAEAMRITSDGDFLVNTTSKSGGEKMTLAYSSNSGPGLNIRDTNAQNGNTFIQFNNGVTTGGAITSNGTTTMTYGSASDYRLKSNLKKLQNALAIVSTLNPVSFIWKKTGNNAIGFIAHEVQEILPDCVVGKKDAKDEKGNDIHQMIDTGSASMIATLTAAIQELIAIKDTQTNIIEELKARLTALESK